ncbi:Putative aflatoxin regulatory protein [Septoria linicola]|uniref:Aflatoxin regulatory protein n=1 Tax=Septoria linicola TaxID=215465 RepID=A0A9Q9B3K4_9PEZI|nr:Putative aflatoxin regulatory protein [Septoria linicola]
MSAPTIKYRAACDHCSATKIKCTQERPQCARCRTLGRDCHYSRSLRAGKPPRSSQGLNRKISNTPVLPRSGPASEPPYPGTNSPMCHGLPTHFAYPVLSPTSRTDIAWSANASPYPTPPAMAAYGNADIPFFPDLNTQDNSSVSTPLDPEWFFDFSNAALATESSVERVDSREPTQQPSPVSDGKQPLCALPTTEIRPYEELSSMPSHSPVPMFQSSGGDQCLRIATDTLNRLYEMPYLQVDAETKQFSIDQVLSNTSRAVQVCHDLITCPCLKDFYLPVIIGMIASKILGWYQAVAFIRDPSTEMQRADGKCPSKELVVDGQLALGAYKLDDKMGWVLKNHVVLGQLQRLKEIVDRYDSEFCDKDVLVQMGEGGKFHGTMGSFLKGRLQFTLQEIEGRLRAGTS